MTFLYSKIYVLKIYPLYFTYLKSPKPVHYFPTVFLYASTPKKLQDVWLALCSPFSQERALFEAGRMGAGKGSGSCKQTDPDQIFKYVFKGMEFVRVNAAPCNYFLFPGSALECSLLLTHQTALS